MEGTTNTPKSIMYFRPGGLGDVLLTIPVLEKTKELMPDAEISLLGHIGAAQLLQDAGYVKNIHRQGRSPDPRVYDDFLEVIGRTKTHYTDEWKQQFRKILHNPDLLIGWSTDPISASYAADYMGLGRHVFEYWQPPPNVHQSEFMVNTARNAGIPISWTYGDGIKPIHFPYELPPRILPSHFDKSRAVILAPGAGASWKRLPIDMFQKLSFELDHQGYLTFVLQGPEEKDENYKKIFVRSLVLKDLSLKELAALLSVRLPYIGNDSGATHLAAACGSPTAVIFTATKALQWAPLGRKVRIVDECPHEKQLSSRSCFDPKCAKRITLDMLLEAFYLTLDASG